MRSFYDSKYVVPTCSVLTGTRKADSINLTLTLESGSDTRNFVSHCAAPSVGRRRSKMRKHGIC